MKNKTVNKYKDSYIQDCIQEELKKAELLLPWIVNPEAPPKEVFSLESYVEAGRMTQEEYELICSYIKERKNILVGGGTGSGKSTLTNAIIQKMTEYTPNDSFFIIEDVPELQCNAHNNTIFLVNKIHTAKVVSTVLRCSPSPYRLIFDEVRYGEVANELIMAWNTGATGNVASIHADSCASMLMRMEDLLREVIPGSIPNLSNTIHLCVHMAGGKQRPHVDEILQNDI